MVLLAGPPRPDPELVALQEFHAAIEALYAKGGHITRAEVRAALDKVHSK